MVFNGILKLMSSLSRTVNCKVKQGFTLIELLVVITLFGITSSLITASYITFERNQRIRNAAQTLKNDLRFAQNKALAGDKGANSECPLTSTLVGWYATFITTQTSSYTYAGTCKDTQTGVETPFSSKIVNFPSGVTLHSIEIGGSLLSGTVVKVLFKPLATGVSLHNTSAPPFLDALGNLTNFASQTGNLVIKLKDQQSASAKYQITVRTSGEVSDVKL